MNDIKSSYSRMETVAINYLSSIRKAISESDNTINFNNENKSMNISCLI